MIDGQQQLLAVAQQHPRLQRRLRRDHAGQRRGAGLRGVRTRDAVIERSSLPVSSRKTSSRVCRSTEMPSGITPCWAHQEVTVASSCGSTLPVTRYAPGVSSAAVQSAGSALSSEPTSRPGRPVKRRVFSAPPRHSSSGVPWAMTRPRVDDRDVVGELLGLVHEVGGEDDRDAVRAQVPDELPGGPAGLRVEAGGRLVQEDQLGAADDGHRQGEPLLLAAGEPPVGRTAAAAEARAARSARPRPAGGRAAWRCGGASRRPGRRSRRRRTGASRRSGAAAPRRRAPGRGPGPGRCRRPACGSPRRSRPWSSCRRRWGRGRR